MGTSLLLGGLFAGSSMLQISAENKALKAQGQANVETAINYIKSMNYSLANLEVEREDAFDATVNDLMKNAFQGHRQERMVEAAVNEGVGNGGGRTAQLLKRMTAMDTNRALASIKENYMRRSNEIDINKEATMLNADRQVKSIRNVEKPSVLSSIFRIGTGFLQGMGYGEQIETMRHLGGVSQGNVVNSSKSILSNGNFNIGYVPKYDFTKTNIMSNVGYNRNISTYWGL